MSRVQKDKTQVGRKYLQKHKKSVIQNNKEFLKQ